MLERLASRRVRLSPGSLFKRGARRRFSVYFRSGPSGCRDRRDAVRGERAGANQARLAAPADDSPGLRGRSAGCSQMLRIPARCARLWRMNEVYAEVFGAHKPARTTVAAGMVAAGMKVEIDCIAYRPQPPRKRASTTGGFHHGIIGKSAHRHHRRWRRYWPRDRPALRKAR